MFAAARNPLRMTLLLTFASFGVLFCDISSAEPTPSPVAVEDAECEKLLAALDKVLAGIPREMTGIDSKRADQMAKDVVRGISDSERFLKQCGQHKRAPEVHYYRMKFLHLMSTRARYDAMRNIPRKGGRVPVGALEQAMKPFYSTLLGHADAAYKGLAKDSKYRPEALEIRGWTNLKLTNYAAARSDYTKYLADYPTSDRCADVTAALSRVYLEVKAFDAGIDLMKKALVDPKLISSKTYPHFGDMLWKLNEAKGDFEGMADAADQILASFPFRAKSRGIPQRTLEMFERTIDISGFRRAYVDFARGSFDAARKRFRKHVEELEEKEKRLKAQNKELKPVASIFRERSRRCADFIDNFAGKEAPIDFQLEGYWVTEKRTTLASSKGKVVAVIFRGVGDTRSATFMQELDEFCSREEKIELLTVCYLHKAKNADEQVVALKDELLDAGYESSAGFDPDPVRKPLFRTYGAYVGSASFMVFDTAGKPIWFQQDPRTIDVNFAKAILSNVRDGR